MFLELLKIIGAENLLNTTKNFITHDSCYWLFFQIAVYLRTTKILLLTIDAIGKAV